MDLHLHSHYSDGTWSPEELVACASDMGLDTISLTDHDTTDGLDEARNFARKVDIEFINGIELSANSMQRKNIHILGYFIDPDNKEVQRVCRHNKSERIRFARKLVHKLNLEGVPLKMEGVYKIAGQYGAIGVSHLTKAIIQAGSGGDITETYETYFGKNSKYGTERDWVSIEVAIKAIVDASGIAVIAHPGVNETTREELSLYKEMGLSGIEVFHYCHSDEDIEQLIAIAGSLDMLITGGSDCHGPWEGGAPSIGSRNISDSMLKGFHWSDREIKA